jgi:hypothetical protein
MSYVCQLQFAEQHLQALDWSDVCEVIDVDGSWNPGKSKLCTSTNSLLDPVPPGGTRRLLYLIVVVCQVAALA